MLLIGLIALCHNGTFGHGHDDGAHETGHAAKAHVEGCKDRAHHAVDADDQAGGGTLELADQGSSCFTQAVALQRAGDQHHDDEDGHAAVCHKGAAQRFQQSDRAQTANQCSHNGCHQNDQNGVQLQCKASDDDDNAK